MREMEKFFRTPKMFGRLYRLILACLCASSALIVLVLSVRTTAFAQGNAQSARVDLAPLQPQNGSVDLSITKTHDSRFFCGRGWNIHDYCQECGKPGFSSFDRDHYRYVAFRLEI
jgi:hypothetical protein